MFRRVLTNPPGQLFLYSMPGRRESIDEFQHEASVQAVSRVVCLNDDLEIARKSPAYAAAIADGTFTCPRDVFPIPNLGVPADRKAFVELARETAARIRAGGYPETTEQDDLIKFVARRIGSTISSEVR